MPDISTATPRALAWHALTELFAGRELQDYDYRSIANALRASGFSRRALEDILLTEVAPVFGCNLSIFAIAEMEGWSPEDVTALITAHLRQRRPWLVRLRQRLWSPKLPALAQHRWQIVLTLLGKT